MIIHTTINLLDERGIFDGQFFMDKLKEQLNNYALPNIFKYDLTPAYKKDNVISGILWLYKSNSKLSLAPIRVDYSFVLISDNTMKSNPLTFSFTIEQQLEYIIQGSTLAAFVNGTKEYKVEETAEDKGTIKEYFIQVINTWNKIESTYANHIAKIKEIIKNNIKK